MTKIEGSIPMKPWLAKFAQRVDNLPDGGVVDISSNTYIARIIKMFLKGKTSIPERAKASSIRKDYGGLLRYSITYCDRMYLSPQDIVSINKLIFSFFHEMLLSRIRYAQRYQIEEKETIYRFLEEYGIEVEEDITFDTIKKASYRLRKSKKIEHFYTTKSRELRRGGFTGLAAR